MTYETHAPGDIIAGFVLSSPELGAENLAKGVADEKDGVGREFLCRVRAMVWEM